MTTCSDRRSIVCATFAILLALVLPTLAAGQKAPALDHALRAELASTPSGQVPVIIRAVPGKRSEVRGKITAKGHGITTEVPSLDALSATVDVADLIVLGQDPSVHSISLDAVVHAHAAGTGPDAL